MEAKRLTGPNAGSLKYDILTALTLTGMHGSSGVQLSLSRLCLLITARYNWRREELSVGQRDMARMWNIGERTVKREVKRWTETKLLICKRPGVRGRVGAYRLNVPEVFALSKPYWSAVGPDFEARMRAENPVQPSKVVQVDFSPSRHEPQEEPRPGPRGTWRAAAERLRHLHPEIYRNWIAALQFISDDGVSLVLKAPSKFSGHYIQTHLMDQLSEAVEAEIGPQRRIVVTETV